MYDSGTPQPCLLLEVGQLPAQLLVVPPLLPPPLRLGLELLLDARHGRLELFPELRAARLLSTRWGPRSKPKTQAQAAAFSLIDRGGASVEKRERGAGGGGVGAKENPDGCTRTTVEYLRRCLSRGVVVSFFKPMGSR